MSCQKGLKRKTIKLSASLSCKTACQKAIGCALHVGTSRAGAVLLPDVSLEQDRPGWCMVCTTYKKGRRSNGPCGALNAPDQTHVS
jgi:hypothetical protein